MNWILTLHVCSCHSEVSLMENVFCCGCDCSGYVVVENSYN
jgi:hypothetical protein